MVRTYKRKTNRQEWSEESMAAAIKEVQEGGAFKTAAKTHQVPVMTLKRRVKGINKKAAGHKKESCIRLQQVAKLFGLAYRKTATIDNALSGFEKTGLCPCNRDIFPDWMFLPSEITDLTQEDVNDKECEARKVTEKENLTEEDDVRRQSIGLDGKVGANHPDEQIAEPSGIGLISVTTN
ncbi:hypothetical protein ANN_19478 [Periplaneta americana]|uniref:HTH psq-type domain-containing protein n=1 Tax=Periplaneta americana TaxID=6978 RepID=A0ABQ8SA06_PERAM|nr:hypothetical protein ANN_19478 [Periplaneta americana]